MKQVLEMPPECSQIGIVQLQLVPAWRGDLDWELLLDKSKSERTVFCGELGFAVDVRVNDDARSGITG